jgi:hypothetical protein
VRGRREGEGVGEEGGDEGGGGRRGEGREEGEDGVMSMMTRGMAEDERTPECREKEGRGGRRGLTRTHKPPRLLDVHMNHRHKQIDVLSFQPLDLPLANFHEIQIIHGLPHGRGISEIVPEADECQF